MKRYIGIDLHKKKFTACYLIKTTAGMEKKFKEFSTDKMEEFLEDLQKTDEIAVETLTNTRYFVSVVSRKVKSVQVVNNHAFKVVSESVKKTDKNDASIIAEFLSKDMLPTIRLREEKYVEIESLAKTRDQLVGTRTGLRTKIGNILQGKGFTIPNKDLNSKKGKEKILDLKINEITKFEIRIIMEQIQYLNIGIKELEIKIIEKGKELKGFENITSITGIGNLSASILLSAIGGVENFAKSKKLDSYLGMVPRVRDSGGKEHHGRITKRGNKLGRKTLVQCAWVAIRYSEYLNCFYTRLKKGKGSGKAIIATARKLLGIIYMTLQENIIFEDFNKFLVKQN